MKARNLILIAMTIILSLSTAAFGKEPLLKSIWKTDGQNAGAGEHTGRFELRDEKVMVGLQNDSDNLYITISGLDRPTQMKMMRGGVTVWLDSTGKKKKTFGVHYPLPAGRRELGQMRRNLDDNPGMPREMPQAMRDTLMIMGADAKDRMAVPSKNDLGLRASIIDSEGPGAIQITVPLKGSNSSPYAVSSSPGNVISIGFETEKPQFGKMGKGPEGGKEGPGGPGGQGGPPDGMGGPGGGHGGPGGMRGGRGGMPRGERGNNGPDMEPINFWIKAQLAEKPK